MTQKRSFPTLSADILIKRQRLPEKPSPIKLTGKYVSLEPIVIARNGHPLFEMPNGTPITLNDRSIDSYDANELIWRYMFDGPFGNVKDFEASLQPYVNTSNGLCFCIFDIASRRQVGIANFMNHLGIAKGTI